MRSIPISTPVFAAIWAQRREGEESEDEILRRLLRCSDSGENSADSSPPSVPTGDPSSGVFDARNNVQFPQGFEIFRNYKVAGTQRLH